MTYEPRSCAGCPAVFIPARAEQRYHDLDCARRASAVAQRRYTCTKCGGIRVRKPGKRRPNALVCPNCERARDRARRSRRKARN